MHAKHGHYDPKVCFTSYIDLLPLFSYFDSVYFARSSQASKEFAARKSLSSLSLEREPFSFGCPRPAVVLLSALIIASLTLCPVINKHMQTHRPLLRPDNPTTSFLATD